LFIPVFQIKQVVQNPTVLHDLWLSHQRMLMGK